MALRRKIAIAAMSLAAMTVIYFAGRPADKDYISYWASGKLLLSGQNPFSANEILKIERSQGYPDARALIMRNPPHALGLTLPIALLPARAGLIVWSCMAFGCVLWSVKALNVAPNDRILCFIFAPVLGSFTLGQSSPFLLLGLVMFLACCEKKPWVAGGGIAMLTIKPLLFLCFWPVLLVYLLDRRKYQIVFSGAAWLAVSLLLVFAFDPAAWSQYAAMIRNEHIQTEFLPTLAVLLRLAIKGAPFNVQFLPSLAASVCCIWFFFLHRDDWDWTRHGLVVLFATVITSPYTWPTDEIVLLPALVAAFSAAGRPRLAIGALVIANTAELLLFVCQVRFQTGAYLWTPIAWVLCYLLCTRGRVYLSAPWLETATA